MQLIDGSPVYSATDLVGFLACEHLTQLERAVLARLAKRPDLPDPELDVLRKRGQEHASGLHRQHRRVEPGLVEQTPAGLTLNRVEPERHAEARHHVTQLKQAAVAHFRNDPTRRGQVMDRGVGGRRPRDR